MEADGEIDGLALVEALWARMCSGIREDGSLIDDNDPIWKDLTTTAKAAKQRPTAWLEQRQIYGSLADNSQFSDAFTRWLGMLCENGVAATLSAYVDQGAAE